MRLKNIIDKTPLAIQILLISFLSFSCKSSSTGPNNFEIRELTVSEKKLVESSESFGLKLFRQVNEFDPNKNIFISPLSVSMALGMTLNGANGSTFDEMRRTLIFNDLTQQEINESYKSLIELLTQVDKTIIFQIANSIWYRQGYEFEKNFIETNKKFFDALVTSLNFDDPNSVNIINNWVNEKTNGKIPQIVDTIGKEIIMFIINAIYFNGNWKYKFDKNLTKEDKFTRHDGTKISVKMMKQKNDFMYLENELFQAVDLPYGNGAFSMTILLPKSGTNINQLINLTDKTNWQNWINSFSKREGELCLPKFKIEYDVLLNDILKALGIQEAFDPYKADFTNLYQGPENAYISKVKHKTFVDVYEEGTEAAAVTSVEIGITSLPQTFVMRVDKPFVFAIREKNSGSILFIGKIIEPKGY